MSRKRQFKFDKLVRDKVPDRMHQKNIHISYYAMDHEEYIGELKRKLLEEAEEVIDANSKVDLIEELADVLEIVYALSEAFEKKIYSKYIEIDSDHTDIEYYLLSPNKYPEIL